MMRDPYVRVSDYREMYDRDCEIDEDRLHHALVSASQHIDTLTFNRIKWDRLTEYQKQIIMDVCCLQAKFEMENADELNSILASYSINGVSAQFGATWNVTVQNGVAMKRDVYALLSQSGLCCRLAR